ncbi:hypothetical protein OAL44_00675 [Planctomycetaceae bacterium]|nr:hypothetical protein [Planctomycetaceae bacterium]
MNYINLPVLNQAEESQIENLYYFVDHGANEIGEDQFHEVSKVDSEETERMLNKFISLGILEVDGSYRSGRNLRIKMTHVVPLFNKINTPDIPDRWNAFVKWFRSKWWSVPLSLLVIVIPILWSWIQFALWLFDKFSG